MKQEYLERVCEDYHKNLLNNYEFIYLLHDIFKDDERFMNLLDSSLETAVSNIILNEFRVFKAICDF